MSADPRLIADFERLKAECEKHLRHYASNPHLRVFEKVPGQPGEGSDVTERENQRDRDLIAEFQRIIDRLKSE